MKLNWTMNISLNQITNNVKAVILEPEKFWVNQKQDHATQRQLLGEYFLPLVLLVAVGVFSGELIRGSHFYVAYPFIKASREILLFSLLYVVSVYFTNRLIKTFGGQKNIYVARKLVVFSLTPFLLVSLITGLFPFLYIVDALGMYGFYIFWAGARELLDFPEKKQTRYSMVTILTNFFVFSFLSIFLTKFLTAFL